MKAADKTPDKSNVVGCCAGPESISRTSVNQCVWVDVHVGSNISYNMIDMLEQGMQQAVSCEKRDDHHITQLSRG